MSKRRKGQSRATDNTIFENYGFGSVHEYETIDVFAEGHTIAELSDVPPSIRLLAATHGKPTEAQWKTVMIDAEEEEGNGNGETERPPSRQIVVTSEQRYAAPDSEDDEAVLDSSDSDQVSILTPTPVDWQRYPDLGRLDACVFCQGNRFARELDLRMSKFRQRSKSDWDQVMARFGAVPHSREELAGGEVTMRYFRFEEASLFVALLFLRSPTTTLANYVFIPATSV